MRVVYRPSRFDPSITLIIGLTVGMVTVTTMAPSRARPVHSPPARCAINPNLAPWWELAVLPRIGENTARRVVSFREGARSSAPDGPAGPVFCRAADLTAVRGIGPRTVARVARYLRFEGC